MELGAFSVSLTVKDIEASRKFYETLGFSVIGGDIEQNWLILRNQNHTLGLFQGMFDKNVLTFNPGWDDHGNPLAVFTDVREIQSQLEKAGLEMNQRADEASTGPSSCVVIDPDGNPVLIDQHV